MTTSELEPGLYWTDMTDSEWSAQNAPWSPAWVATLARNTECHKRALYGLGSFVGNVPHDHRTSSESAHLSPAVGTNVCQASCPALSIGDSEGRYEGDIWTASGFSIATRDPGGGGVFDEDSRGVEGGTGGGYASQRLYAVANGVQSQMFGDGCDLVLGVFIRMMGAPTRGLIQFGISSQRDSVAVSGRDRPGDESDISINGPGTFGPRQSGAIHHSDLSTSWKRFYVRVMNAGRDIQGDVRITLDVAKSFNEKIQATGFTVTHGRRLYPWAPSPGDLPQTPTWFGHTGWQNMPNATPLMDWDISMTDAIKLEPI